MPQSLVQTMQAIIEPPYALPKVGAMFEIVETAKTAKNKKVLIGGAQGFGFTLDQPTGGHSAYFGAFRSVISGLSDHPFRFKPITDSAIIRSLLA